MGSPLSRLPFRHMRLVLTLGGLILIAACSQSTSSGSDGEGSSNSRGTQAAPACSETWRLGEVLPSDYRECVVDSGETERTDFHTCLDGTFIYVHHDMWAARGQVIGLAAGPDYVRAVEACRTA